MHFSTPILALALSPIGSDVMSQLVDAAHGTVSSVFQFPDGTWPENLAVRANGEVIVTDVEVPQLFLVDPVSKTSKVIFQSDDAINSIFGITEVATDVFVFSAGNFSLANGSTPGTYSAWTIDFRDYEKTQIATAAKITDIPEAAVLNGVTSVSPTSTKVLMVDSFNPAVFAVDYKTGQYEKTMTGETLTFTDQAGGNGIRVHDGFAYYTNTDLKTVFRVPIDNNGRPTGTPVALAHSVGDDLFIAEDGKTVYVAEVFSDDVVAIDVESGVTQVVADRSDSLLISHPTAVALGRTDKDRMTLYTTTTGAAPGSVGATPPQLLAIELPRREC